ncbi:MAG: CCE_0567 family metalloprotein [Pseudomonadota bacterium]|nr:CCE_0567 family metalloprotein [Pseudomonadota bacterium]
MTADELKALKKEVAKKKRIASEWASQLHDLVEDRLPEAYEDIPKLAQSTYQACQDWAEAQKRFQEAQNYG